MRPTRIVKPPFEKLNDERKWKLYISCNNGVEYTLQELAELIGMKTGHGIWQRINKYGWDHPMILAPAKRGGHTVTGITSGRGEANIDYTNLSGRVRTAKLLKIPPCGTWEAKQCK